MTNQNNRVNKPKEGDLDYQKAFKVLCRLAEALIDENQKLTRDKENIIKEARRQYKLKTIYNDVLNDALVLINAEKNRC